LEGTKGSPSKLTRWGDFLRGPIAKLARASRERRTARRASEEGGGFELGIVIGR